MRIHSDVLTPVDLSDALKQAGLSDVSIEYATVHQSRKRRWGIEVRLEAEPKKGRRRRNTGVHGAEWGVAAATWDEHGAWMARLFEVDPDAIIGPYHGRDLFHTATRDQYRIKEN